MPKFLSFTGRMGRKEFAVIYFVLLALAQVIKLIPSHLVQLLVLAVPLWLQLAAQAKRFQDFGMSGWTNVVFMALAVTTVVAGQMQAVPVALFSAIGLIGMVAMLLLRPGDVGDNKYGAPGSGFVRR